MLLGRQWARRPVWLAFHEPRSFTKGPLTRPFPSPIFGPISYGFQTCGSWQSDDLGREKRRQGTFVRDPRQGRQGLDFGQLSPAATNAKQRLVKEHPADIFHDLARDKDTPLDVMRLCLRDYFERLKKVPRTQRRDLILGKPIGGMALQYAWDSDRWVDLVLEDYETQMLLCYFLIGEQLDDLVVQWTLVDLPPGKAATLEKRELHLWRGILLRNLIRAHLMLDSEAKADLAIEAFFKLYEDQLQAWARVTRLKRTLPESELPSVVSVSRWPAQVELASALAGGSYSNTSTVLWERFTAYYFAGRPKVQTGMMERDYKRVGLALVHPTRPDARPAIEYLRKIFNQDSHHDFMSKLPPAGTPAYVSYQRMFNRARQSAQSAGLFEDAAWLEETALKIFGRDQHSWPGHKSNAAYRHKQ